jgi:hypothetical protein
MEADHNKISHGVLAGQGIAAQSRHGPLLNVQQKKLLSPVAHRFRVSKGAGDAS